MTNILILGASGIIGTYLVEQFKKLKKNNLYNVKGYSSSELNLLNNKEIDEFLKNNTFEIIIFLVGLAHKKGKRSDIAHFDEINYLTLYNLMTSIKKNRVRFKKIIFSSTISVYGEDLNNNLYLEDCKKNPESPYALTKLKAERFLTNTYKEKSWILRLAPVYSKTFRLNLNRRIKIKNCFFKVGNGSNKLSLCNIKNLDIVINSILQDIVPAGTYNISDQQIYTFQDLLKSQNPGLILRIPKTLILMLYYIGIIIDNVFLKENSVKLYNDNVFSSKKIQKYIKLPFSLIELTHE